MLTQCVAEVTPLPRSGTKFADTFVENEPLVLGIGTATTVGFVQGKAKGGKSKKAYNFKLNKPVCAKQGDTIAVLRRSSNRWHFYGTAKILS